MGSAADIARHRDLLIAEMDGLFQASHHTVYCVHLCHCHKLTSMRTAATDRSTSRETPLVILSKIWSTTPCPWQSAAALTSQASCSVSSASDRRQQTGERSPLLPCLTACCRYRTIATGFECSPFGSHHIRDYELGDVCASVNDFLQDIYQLVWLVTFIYVIYKTNGAWSRLKVRSARLCLFRTHLFLSVWHRGLQQ